MIAVGKGRVNGHSSVYSDRIILDAFHMYSQLISPSSPQNRYYNYPHFSEEEMEVVDVVTSPSLTAVKLNCKPICVCKAYAPSTQYLLYGKLMKQGLKHLCKNFTSSQDDITRMVITFLHETTKDTDINVWEKKTVFKTSSRRKVILREDKDG